MCVCSSPTLFKLFYLCQSIHSHLPIFIDITDRVKRDRETERQRDRETERQRDRETERQRDRETERERQRDRETKRLGFL